MNAPRKVFLVIGAAALLLVGCGKEQADSAAKLPPPTGKGAEPRPALPALEAMPDASQGEHTVQSNASSTTGTTYPSHEAQLGPKMSGIIAHIAVEEGARVKKGQILFRMDTSEIALRGAQARAALKAAEVQLNSTKIEFDRMQRLLEQKAVDRAAFDRVEALHQGAQVGVEQAKVGVSMADQAMADAVVRSPLDGIITHKHKNEGEMATMMPPTIVVVVEDHSPLELRFRLPERALAQVHPGDDITVNFSAVDVKRVAKVRRIDPTMDARTRTVEIIADVHNDDGNLKPGMLGEIELGKK